MLLRLPSFKPTYTLFPYTTLFRALDMRLHCADLDPRPFCDLANAGIFQSGFRGDIEQCRRKQVWTRGGFSAFRHTATLHAYGSNAHVRGAFSRLPAEE